MPYNLLWARSLFGWKRSKSKRRSEKKLTENFSFFISYRNAYVCKWNIIYYRKDIFNMLESKMRARQRATLRNVQKTTDMHINSESHFGWHIISLWGRVIEGTRRAQKGSANEHMHRRDHMWVLGCKKSCRNSLRKSERHIRATFRTEVFSGSFSSLRFYSQACNR